MQANSGSTMLNNIVNNIKQCGQQNIVPACFHQARTGCSFLAVKKKHRELGKFFLSQKNLPPDKMSGRLKVVPEKAQFLLF